MSGIKTVIRLVQGLTKAEKKNFRLVSGIQHGDKDYCKLYDLICSLKANESNVQEKFKEIAPKADLNATSSYLYQILINCLIHNNQDFSVDEMLLKGIQEIRILFRKGLIAEGFRLIDKLRKIAISNEKMVYAIHLDKLDLHYKTRTQYLDITESDIIKIQSRLRKNIMYELNLSDHSSLYELLYYRYLKEGIARSQNDREKLNDLVVTEMNLAGNPRFQSFDLKKNHLLFQSVYFMMVGDYKSSLITYYELNKLFDDHRPLWNETPVIYINHIRGIINNLQNSGQFDDMSFFINKLHDLQKETSVLLLQQTIYVSELKMFLGLHLMDSAADRVSLNQDLSSKVHLLTPTDRAETILYTSLVYIHLRKLKIAAKLLREVIHMEYIQNHQLRRMLRLINLIVHFQLHDFDYLTSEIRSLDRELKASKIAYNTEICIMRMMLKSLNVLPRSSRKKLFEDAKTELEKLKENPFEKPLFMTFDFLEWIKGCS